MNQIKLKDPFSMRSIPNCDIICSSSTKVFSSALRLIQFIVTGILMLICGCAPTNDPGPVVVRLAKLTIDSAQLEMYRVALQEEIEMSLRVEKGVLTLYAVSEMDNPTHITVFEIYASADAYRSHLETPHFKKYKEGTKDMVQALELIEADPIALNAKGR